MIERSAAAEWLPIVQAFADKKAVERQKRDGNWSCTDFLYMDEPPNHYRIKPERRRVFLVFVGDARLTPAYDKKLDAEAAAYSYSGAEIVEFVEVEE